MVPSKDGDDVANAVHEQQDGEMAYREERNDPAAPPVETVADRILLDAMCDFASLPRAPIRRGPEARPPAAAESAK